MATFSVKFNSTENTFQAEMNGSGQFAAEFGQIFSYTRDTFETDETLILENGVLRVNTAHEVGDQTLPITAAAVNNTVGNIEILLQTI